MKPMFLKLQLTPATVGRKSQELFAFGKALGKAGMQFRGDFAAPPLRPQDPRNGDIRVYSTISNW